MKIDDFIELKKIMDSKSINDTVKERYENICKGVVISANQLFDRDELIIRLQTLIDDNEESSIPYVDILKQTKKMYNKLK